ncbi:MULTISPECIES: hypothetical protein [Shewanella]|uniref:hypothetical protein n=1 Tax=Shewanella TaxID=22 RepID=UPI001F4C32FF|nr:hypothetical protein [Shewanella sp. MM_2022_3]MCH7421387.1 hypothetical protein [Shewanella sp. MM_2022_3]
MNNHGLEHQVKQALSVFLAQYQQPQQQVLRRALLIELERMSLQLMSLNAEECFSDLRHEFLGMTSYLGLDETLCVSNLASVSAFNTQIQLLLNAVKEQDNGE